MVASRESRVSNVGTIGFVRSHFDGQIGLNRYGMSPPPCPGAVVESRRMGTRFGARRTLDRATSFFAIAREVLRTAAVAGKTTAAMSDGPMLSMMYASGRAPMSSRHTRLFTSSMTIAKRRPSPT